MATDSKRKAKPPTLSDRAYTLLKEDILAGRLEEGQFLDVEALLRRYRIGRTPFRESCNRLFLERLLEVVPNRGYLVRETSFRELRDIIETRIVVEREIGAIAALRRTEEDLRRLEQSCAKSWQIALERPNDREGIVKANLEFHLCLAGICHNRELLLIATALLERMRRVSILQLPNTTAEEIRALHEPIVSAVRLQDLHATREAICKDIAQGQRDVFHPIVEPADDVPFAP